MFVVVVFVHDVTLEVYVLLFRYFLVRKDLFTFLAVPDELVDAFLLVRIRSEHVSDLFESHYFVAMLIKLD